MNTIEAHSAFPLHIPGNCWQSLEELSEREEDIGLAYRPTVRSIGRQRRLLGLGEIAALLDAAAQIGETAVRYMTQHLQTESLAVIAHTANSETLQHIVHSGGRFPAALEATYGVPRWMHRKMQSQCFIDVPISVHISLELLGQVPLRSFPNSTKEAGELVVLLYELVRHNVMISSAHKVIEFSLANGYGGSLTRFQALIEQCVAYCGTARSVGSHLTMCDAIALLLERIDLEDSRWGEWAVLDKSISATVLPVFQKLGFSTRLLINELLRAHPKLPSRWAGYEVHPLDTVTKLMMSGVEYENCIRMLSQIFQHTGDGIAVYSMWQEKLPYCMFALALRDGRLVVVENFHTQNLPARPMAKAMVQAFADSFNEVDIARFRRFTSIVSVARNNLGIVQN